MTEAISITAGLSIFCLVRFLLDRRGQEERKLAERLKRLAHLYEKPNEASELELPFAERVIRPFLEVGGMFLRRVTPKRIMRGIETGIIRAGAPWGLTQSRWIVLRILSGAVCPMVLCVVLAAVRGWDKGTLLATAVVALFSNAIPKVLLERLAGGRKLRIEHELPDALDLISVSVEAGLSFDGALGKIVEKMDGPLSEEFKTTLGEMRLGATRKKALSNMGDRCGVPELTSFLASVIQAEELGVAITNVLRIQSMQLRDKRKQKAQEKAMKAPIKILFPLIFFIFPAIFVIILGPSVIRMIDIFGR